VQSQSSEYSQYQSRIRNPFRRAVTAWILRGRLRVCSADNDPFYKDGSGIHTRTNYSGGIQGGISNGEPVIIRAAFKPTATILAEQETVDIHGNPTTLKGRGRHDPCVLPRAVPIVEAMMALVLADHYLRQRGQSG